MRTMTVSGNLGGEPEQKQSQSGNQFATFSLAVNQNRKDNNGNYGTDWVRCTVFGVRVNTIMQYYHKGSHVVVTGDWELSTWTDQQGNFRAGIGMTVRDLDLPSNGQAPNSQGQQGYSNQGNYNRNRGGYQNQQPRSTGYNTQDNNQPRNSSYNNTPFAENGTQANFSDSDLPF